jgi:hypothetical protein
MSHIEDDDSWLATTWNSSSRQLENAATIDNQMCGYKICSNPHYVVVAMAMG